MYIQKYLFISKIQKSANFYKIFICCFRYMLFGINQDVWVDFLHKKIRLPKGNRMILSFIRARDGIRTLAGSKKPIKSRRNAHCLPCVYRLSTVHFISFQDTIYYFYFENAGFKILIAFISIGICHINYVCVKAVKRSAKQIHFTSLLLFAVAATIPYL